MRNTWRFTILALLVFLTTLSIVGLAGAGCFAADQERTAPRAGVQFGQQLPDGSQRPGLAATLDFGNRASLFAGVGQSAMDSGKPGGTAGMSGPGGMSGQGGMSGMSGSSPSDIGAARFEPSGALGLTVRF